MTQKKKIVAKTEQPSENEQNIQKRLVRYRMLPEEKRDAFLLSKKGLELVQWMARENYSDVRIAFELQKPDMKEFRDKNPIIDLYYEYGQDMRITDVEDAMFKSAKGFTVKEDYTMTYYDRDGNIHENSGSRMKTFPPDPRAQQYILNNKRPKTYKEKQEPVQTVGFSGINVDIRFIDGEDAEPKNGE